MRKAAVAIGMMVAGALAPMGSARADDAPAATGGDAAAGMAKAKVCKTCHQWGEGAKNSIGPVLNGIVDRKAGTYPDYNYSDANKNSGLVWTEANLKTYLKNPKAMIPGTKMVFSGFSSDKDIDNVVAFLKTLGPDGKTK